MNPRPNRSAPLLPLEPLATGRRRSDGLPDALAALVERASRMPQAAPVDPPPQTAPPRSPRPDGPVAARGIPPPPVPPDSHSVLAGWLPLLAAPAATPARPPSGPPRPETPAGPDAAVRTAAAEATGGATAPLTCHCPVCAAMAIDPEAVPGDYGRDPGPPLVDLAATFRLHSNPGATKTIYLDFDGHSMASSQWAGGGALRLAPFYPDIDPDPDRVWFADRDLAEIQRIWQRMCEDFAPFNVNVTTEDPGVANLVNSGGGDTRWGIRVSFNNNFNEASGRIIQPLVNGVAYLRSFYDGSDDPAHVFIPGDHDAANIASHEVGHALGLNHDGSSSGPNPNPQYYSGHGGNAITSWAPIMGSPLRSAYRENVTAWSRGEYIGANNGEDDLAIISNGSNGFGYRADDFANSAAGAFALSGLEFSQYGIIERNSDVDWFRFDVGTAGPVSLSITNATRLYLRDGTGAFTSQVVDGLGPNLDIAAKLFDGAGSLIASSNPLDDVVAGFDLELAPGRYSLSIDGVGVGDPFAASPTGYTDYGSLGQYRVRGRLPGPAGIRLGSADALVTSERGDSLAVPVSLTGRPAEGSTVVLRVTSLDPGEGSVDVETLRFSAADWNQPQTVRIRGVDDGVLDDSQAYGVRVAVDPTLTTDPAYLGVAPRELALTNLDDELPALLVTTAAEPVLEGRDLAVLVEVSLSHASALRTTVTYGTAGGSAVAGSDFTAVSGTLDFETGTTRKTVAIPIANNNLDQADRSFRFVLSSPANAVLVEGGSTTITISDTLRSPVSTTLPGGVENLELTGTAPIDGTGNGGANRILGNDAANGLRGGGGLDTLTGRGGVDTFDLSGLASAANRVRVTDFVSGAPAAGGEGVRISNSLTTRSSAAGVVAVAALARGTAASLNTGSSGFDLFVLGGDNPIGDANLAAATDGAALLDAINPAAGSASLTTTSNGGRGYLLAYQGSRAYLYNFFAGSGTTSAARSLSAAEIQLIGTFEGLLPDSLAAANFTLV